MCVNFLSSISKDASCEAGDVGGATLLGAEFGADRQPLGLESDAHDAGGLPEPGPGCPRSSGTELVMGSEEEATWQP